MINKLTITNFQSHKSSELEFVPGMNVIIGDTDSGKTAIIRALNWCMFNKPGGDAFRSNWGGETTVDIQIENHNVIRSKDNSSNTYQLNDMVFKAFGQGVPEEITRFFNIDEVNIQQQMDSPYLLSETPGAIATHFNKVAKLDIIDEASQNIQKEIRQINADIVYTKEQVEEYEQKINTLPDLDEFEYQLELIEQEELRLSTLQATIHEITKLVKEIEKIELIIQKKAESIKDTDIVEHILFLFNEIKQKNDQYANLKKLALDIYYLQKDIEKKEILIVDEPLINKIQINLNLYVKSVESQKNLQKLVHNITNITNVLKSKENNLSKLEEDFKANFPNICPLCNSKIK